jgi:dolichol-phosphate mannosyltransferase
MRPAERESGMGTTTRTVCVLPAWNEGAKIAAVVRAVPADVVDTTVVVDDGSTDDTADQAEAAGAVVIRQGRNQGVGAAIRSGIDYALSNDYDIVVVASGAGKTPPEEIPRLLRPLLEDGVDLAQGSRYVAGGQYRHMPLHRRLGTVAYTKLFSLLAWRDVSDASSGFRAFRVSLLRDARIDLWQSWLDRYELEPYLLYTALRYGHKVVEVPVTIAYPPPSAPGGYTKMRKVIDWWKIFRPVVFLAFGIRR